jgi:hypothetical protein
LPFAYQLIVRQRFARAAAGEFAGFVAVTSQKNAATL